MPGSQFKTDHTEIDNVYETQEYYILWNLILSNDGFIIKPEKLQSQSCLVLTQVSSLQDVSPGNIFYLVFYQIFTRLN